MKKDNLFSKFVQIKKYWIFFLLFLSILISVIITYESYFVNILNTIWVNPIASHLIKGLGLWGNIAVTLIILIYYIIAYINERYKYTKRFFIVFMLAFFTYLCQISDNWIFYSYKDISILAYANIIYFIFLFEVVIILHSTFRKKGNNQSLVLKYDVALETDEDDKYSRKKYANTITQIIQSNFSDQGSFCFGLIGKWGSGKSTFMNLIKNEISKDKTIVTIDFNVWKAKSPTEIIDEFFGQYHKIIEKHCPSLSNTIDNYAKILIQAIHPEGEKWYHKITLLKGETNNKAIYDKICSVLKSSQINVLIFIDDLDRLHNPEILEVLRLIRNTVNFPYTQFVVAYDKSYVIRSLENNGIVNAAEYLEKIYNTEIYLPTFSKMIIIEGIENNLNSFFKDNDIPKDSLYHQLRFFIDEEIGTEDDNYLIPRLFKTQRDVIRFTNSFITNLRYFIDNKIYNCINIRDFFYLELVRYAFPDIYEIIRINPCNVLSLDFAEKQYIFNKDKINKVLVKNEDERIILEKILEILFSESNGDFNSVRFYRSFPVYFSFNLDPKCLQLFEVIDAIGSEDPLDIVQQWIKNKHDQEIYNRMSHCFKIIENIDSIRLGQKLELSYEELYPFITKILKTDNNNLHEIHNATYAHIKHLRTATTEQFFELIKLWFVILKRGVFDVSDPLENSKILNGILHENNLANYLHNPVTNEAKKNICKLLLYSEASYQLSPLIREYINNFYRSNSVKEERLLLPIKYLERILIIYLRNHTLDPNNIVNNNFFTLLYNCVNRIYPRSDKEFINKETLEIAHTFITEKPDGYFSMFIRKKDPSSDEINTIYPEPLYKLIFGSNEAFESFIGSEELSSLKNIEKVRNYWVLYKNNSYKPIEFILQGSIEDIINSNFMDFKIKVEKLIKIQSEVGSIKLSTSLDESERLERLLAKKKDVEDINFNIELTQDILKIINDES